jgi:hypothetical protein
VLQTHTVFVLLILSLVAPIPAGVVKIISSKHGQSGAARASSAKGKGGSWHARLLIQTNIVSEERYHTLVPSTIRS